MVNGHLSAQQSAVLSAAPRYGIVDSYDPKTYRAKVVLAPSTDGVTPMTGYLPLLTGYMGNGWGMVAPVQKGDQVIVLFMQNHPDQGVILGRIYDQAHTTPMGDVLGRPPEGGELVLQHESGSLIQLSNFGNATILAKSRVIIFGPNVELHCDLFDIVGNVTIGGTLDVSGEGIFNSGTGTGHTVSQHTHGGVASGGATTAKPQG